MPEGIGRTREISFFCETHPVIPERGLWKKAAGLIAKDPFRLIWFITADIFLNYPARDLVQVDLAACIFVLSFRDLVSVVYGPGNGQNTVPDVRRFDPEDIISA